MELNFFQFEVIYNHTIENKGNPICKYANDYSNTLYLFTMRNNSIVYYNKTTSLVKTIDEYRSMIVLNTLFTFDNAIALLYSNGDLIIIPISFIENDLFNRIWEKLSSIKESNLNSKPKSFNNIIIQSRIANKTPILSEFLQCGRGLGVNLMQKMDGFSFKNVFADYIDSSINDKHMNNDRGIFTFSSMELWLNNKIEYLLITIDTYFLIIDVALSECVFKYCFNDSIYSMILLSLVDFEYVIIQYEKEYYSLTLFDKDNNINILTKDNRGKISPHQLISLTPNSILSIQYYNKEKVLCSLTQLNSFDIYNIYDLTKPLFTINMANPSYLKPKSELINCFLYKKMLITITKHDSIYYLSLINYWIGNDDSNKSISTSLSSFAFLYNERLWCNIDYSLLEDKIILSKKFENKIVLCNKVKNNHPPNENSQYSLLILTKNSLISLSPMITSLMINSMTKVLKESFTYNTLRKLELFNNGLNGLIYEYNDILINELCKEKEIMLKLLWSLSIENINALLKDIIDNILSNGFKIIKNQFDFKKNIIDYLLFYLVNKRGNVSVVYSEYLCRLYISLIFKKECWNSVYDLIIGKVKKLTKYYFEEENLLNKKKTIAMSEEKTSSISSLIQLNNSSFCMDNDGEEQCNMVNGIVYVELGVSNRVDGNKDNKKDNDINNNSSILPNNYFSHLKVSKQKITSITSPMPTVYSNKVLFEKILLIAFFSPLNAEINIEEDNTPTNIDIYFKKTIDESLLSTKDYSSHVKLFILFILLNGNITISDRMIEEVLIIKLTNPLIAIESLISFIIKLFIFPSIISNNSILLNSFSIIQSSIIYSQYIKDSQSLSKESINSFFNKSIHKFLIENNKSQNREIDQLKTVISIVFLFYYYKIIVVVKEFPMNNQSQTIACIKDLIKLISESNERKNKFLSKYINELRLSIYSKAECYVAHMNSSSYYESILNEMKIKKEQLINGTLTINELIEKNNSDLFKQNCLLKYFKNN